MRMHLEYINLQILSVVTQSQLQRAFARRSNFDLSRLLEGGCPGLCRAHPPGSEPFLNKLVEQCQDDLSFFTTTLQPLRMPPGLRDTAAAALMPPAKFKVGPLAVSRDIADAAGPPLRPAHCWWPHRDAVTTTAARRSSFW